MSIVNFAVPRPLEKKIAQVIKTQGFASKAEFFRFAALHYIQNLREDISQEEFENSIRSFKSTLEKVTSKKKFPSLKEQLADIE